MPLCKLRKERKSPNKGALEPRELVFEGKDEQENVKKEDKKQKKEKIQRNRGKENGEEEEAEKEEEDQDEQVGDDGWEVLQKDTFDLCSEDQVATTKVKRRRWAELNREQVWKRTEGHCYLCGAALKFENRRVGQDGAWHMEHILCLSNNPDFDTVENILPACARYPPSTILGCNLHSSLKIKFMPLIHTPCQPSHRDNLHKGAHTLSEACAKYKWTLYSRIRDSSLHNDACIPLLVMLYQFLVVLTLKCAGS